MVANQPLDLCPYQTRNKPNPIPNAIRQQCCSFRNEDTTITVDSFFCCLLLEIHDYNGRLYD